MSSHKLSEVMALHDRASSRLCMLLAYQGSAECARAGEEERVAHLIKITRETLEIADRVLKKEK